MKTIELFIDENGEWIERISLVEDPAIESDFLCFGKEKLYFADEEKHIITGAVMIPDFKMWRNTNGGCWVYFSEQTVRDCAYRFLKENRTHQFNLDHKTDTDDVYIIESWVKENELDKSTALGFEKMPKGTWFISCKVDSPELWNEIKSGEFKGFSIEGTFLFNDSEAKANDSSTKSEDERIIEEAEKFLRNC